MWRGEALWANVTPTNPKLRPFSLTAGQQAQVWPDRVSPVTAIAPMTPTLPPRRAGNNEDFNVYVLDIAGGSVWIGRESARQRSQRCKFAGGGTCQGNGLKPPGVIWTSGSYTSLEEATKALCRELRGKRTVSVPVAGDSKAAVYGGNYWIGLAPRCR